MTSAGASEADTTRTDWPRAHRWVTAAAPLSPGRCRSSSTTSACASPWASSSSTDRLAPVSRRSGPASWGRPQLGPAAHLVHAAGDRPLDSEAVVLGFEVEPAAVVADDDLHPVRP